MTDSTNKAAQSGGRWVYCRYIVRNGRVIYPKKARFFRFWVSRDK